MRKNFKGIKKKTSVLEMYGHYFAVLLLSGGIAWVVYDIMTNPLHNEFYNRALFGGSMMLLGIMAIVVVVGLVYVSFNLFLDFYHQTKLPLNKEEMEKLNITNPDEYLEFVNNYLPIIIPSTNIQNRIIFTSYLFLYDEDTDEEKEKILQNAFKFSKAPVCIDNYEYIYDFSNKVTVCHDKYFNELTAKLFSNEVYSSVFYEDIETTGEKEC